MPAKKINIYHDIKLILEQARTKAVRAVNFSMVVAYWKIGERIVEEELKGKKRAQYGERLIEELAIKLSTDFGKGFTATNIKYMRLFYIAFPICHAVSDELKHESKAVIPAGLRTELSWTHYRCWLQLKTH